ncbi:MAG: hypothetical protein ABH869_08420, partial [Candidatus Omnitrophota bacterium]
MSNCTKKMLKKVIATGVVCLFAINVVFGNETAFALAPWLGVQKMALRRESERLTLEKQGYLVYEDNQDPKGLLFPNKARSLLLPDGKLLISKNLKRNDLKLLRAVIHEEIEAIMQIIAREDPQKYSAIKEIILIRPWIETVYQDLILDKKEDFLTGNRLLNDILANAFEIIILLEQGLMREQEMAYLEKRFIDTIYPLIKATKHNYFTGVFWERRVRDLKIRLFLANGQSFFQARDTKKDPDNREKLEQEKKQYLFNLTNFYKSPKIQQQIIDFLIESSFDAREIIQKFESRGFSFSEISSALKELQEKKLLIKYCQPEEKLRPSNELLAKLARDLPETKAKRGQILGQLFYYNLDYIKKSINSLILKHPLLVHEDWEDLLSTAEIAVFEDGYKPTTSWTGYMHFPIRNAILKTFVNDTYRMIKSPQNVAQSIGRVFKIMSELKMTSLKYDMTLLLQKLKYFYPEEKDGWDEDKIRELWELRQREREASGDFDRPADSEDISIEHSGLIEDVEDENIVNFDIPIIQVENETLMLKALETFTPLEECVLRGLSGIDHDGITEAGLMQALGIEVDDVAAIKLKFSFIWEGKENKWGQIAERRPRFSRLVDYDKLTLEEKNELLEFVEKCELRIDYETFYKIAAIPLPILKYRKLILKKMNVDISKYPGLFLMDPFSFRFIRDKTTDSGFRDWLKKYGTESSCIKTFINKRSHPVRLGPLAIDETSVAYKRLLALDTSIVIRRIEEYSRHGIDYYQCLAILEFEPQKIIPIINDLKALGIERTNRVLPLAIDLMDSLFISVLSKDILKRLPEDKARILINQRLPEYYKNARNCNLTYIKYCVRHHLGLFAEKMDMEELAQRSKMKFKWKSPEWKVRDRIEKIIYSALKRIASDKNTQVHDQLVEYFGDIVRFPDSEQYADLSKQGFIFKENDSEKFEQAISIWSEYISLKDAETGEKILNDVFDKERGYSMLSKIAKKYKLDIRSVRPYVQQFLRLASNIPEIEESVLGNGTKEVINKKLTENQLFFVEKILYYLQHKSSISRQKLNHIITQYPGYCPHRLSIRVSVSDDKKLLKLLSLGSSGREIAERDDLKKDTVLARRERVLTNIACCLDIANLMSDYSEFENLGYLELGKKDHENINTILAGMNKRKQKTLKNDLIFCVPNKAALLNFEKYERIYDSILENGIPERKLQREYGVAETFQMADNLRRYISETLIIRNEMKNFGERETWYYPDFLEKDITWTLSILRTLSESDINKIVEEYQLLYSKIRYVYPGMEGVREVKSNRTFDVARRVIKEMAKGKDINELMTKSFSIEDILNVLKVLEYSNIIANKKTKEVWNKCKKEKIPRYEYARMTGRYLERSICPLFSETIKERLFKIKKRVKEQMREHLFLSKGYDQNIIKWVLRKEFICNRKSLEAVAARYPFLLGASNRPRSFIDRDLQAVPLMIVPGTGDFYASYSELQEKVSGLKIPCYGSRFFNNSVDPFLYDKEIGEKVVEITRMRKTLIKDNNEEFQAPDYYLAAWLFWYQNNKNPLYMNRVLSLYPALFCRKIYKDEKLLIREHKLLTYLFQGKTFYDAIRLMRAEELFPENPGEQQKLAQELTINECVNMRKSMYQAIQNMLSIPELRKQFDQAKRTINFEIKSSDRNAAGTIMIKLIREMTTKEFDFLVKQYPLFPSAAKRGKRVIERRLEALKFIRDSGIFSDIREKKLGFSESDYVGVISDLFFQPVLRSKVNLRISKRNNRISLDPQDREKIKQKLRELTEKGKLSLLLSDYDALYECVIAESPKLDGGRFIRWCSEDQYIIRCVAEGKGSTAISEEPFAKNNSMSILKIIGLRNKAFIILSCHPLFRNCIPMKSEEDQIRKAAAVRWARYKQKNSIEHESNRRVMHEDFFDKKGLLHPNRADALLLSNGKKIISDQAERDDLAFLRNDIHEDIEAIMQVIAKKDRGRYTAISDLILKDEVLDAYFDLFLDGSKYDLSGERLLNDILACAFEMLILIEDELIS